MEIEKIKSLIPGKAGQLQKFNQKKEQTNRFFSTYINNKFEILIKNNSLINQNICNNLFNSINIVQKKLKNTLIKKEKLFNDYDIIAKYETMLNNALQSQLNIIQKLKELIRINDIAKQAKADAKKHNNIEKYEKINQFIQNKLKPARLSIENELNLTEPEIMSKIKKSKKLQLTENSSKKTRRILDCPMFGVDIQQRYDTKTNSYQTVYKLDDDEYVLAIIRDISTNRYLMASQYRFGAERYMLEFIGGGVNPGEEPEDAIIREIYEETKNKSKLDNRYYYVI